MLVRCNLNCKDNVTTSASLDEDTNEAICDNCGDVLKNITSYAKNAMKINGDVLKKAKGKAFNFKCITCNKEMQAISKDGELVGATCSRQADCKFNISKYMQRGIELYSVVDDETDEQR